MGADATFDGVLKSSRPPDPPTGGGGGGGGGDGGRATVSVPSVAKVLGGTASRGSETAPSKGGRAVAEVGDTSAAAAADEHCSSTAAGSGS